jgi:hypothetical protein
LVVVILVFKGAATAAKHRQTVLRQVLKDANYESENLSAGVGAENADARSLVRRIKRAMIGADYYPLSPNSLNQNRHSGLDAWENEGGSVGRPTSAR